MEMKPLLEQAHEVFIHNYKPFPVVFERGEGNCLFDVEGKKYLDFVAGIAVNALGYSDETLKNALKQQIDAFTHCSNLYYNKPSIDAASKLVAASGLDQVFFCNSGAEANEAAFKLARKYARKHYPESKSEIVSMKNSFHGRTIAAITVTGQEKYQKGLSPLLPGVSHTPYNDLSALEEVMNENTCALILEIIQGEGGIVTIDEDFLKGARTLCDRYDAALIYDEVQTGIGRTGEIFAFQHFGVKPDILSLAKGLGAGVPIGAMVANEKWASGFEPGDHASTFGGNPLATTAANVVLEALMTGELLANVKKQGDYLGAKLDELMAQKNNVLEVKGLGLMRGIAIEGSIPELVGKCMEKGLLVVGAGSNVVRMVPPLTITEQEIDEAIAILGDCLQ